MLPVFLVRLIVKEDFGTFQQAWLVCGIFYSLLGSSISDSLYFFIPQLQQEKRKQFLYQVMGLHFLVGVLAGCALLFLSNFISTKFHNPSLLPLLKISSIFVIFWIGGNYFIHFLITHAKYKFSIFIGVIETGSNLASITIPLVLGFTLNVSFMIFSLMVAIRASCYALYVIHYYRNTTASNWDSSLLMSQIKYSYPMQLSGWIDVFGSEIGKIIISLTYPPVIFAIYSVGATKIPLWQVITNSTNAILRVKFSELFKEKQFDNIVTIWKQAIRKQALIIFPLVFFLIIFADKFIVSFFTIEYSESIKIFQILMIGTFMHAISTSVIPMSTGNTKIILRGSIVYTVFNVILCLLFVRVFGYYGPAIATVLSIYIVATYYIREIVRITGAKIKDLLPFKDISKILMYCLISVFAVSIFKKIHFSSLFVLICSFVLYIFIYLTLVLMNNFLSIDDRTLILRWLKLKPLFSRI